MKKLLYLALITLTFAACNTKEDPTPNQISENCQWLIDQQTNYQNAVDSLDYYHNYCYLFQNVEDRQYYCSQFEQKSWLILNYATQRNLCDKSN